MRILLATLSLFLLVFMGCAEFPEHTVSKTSLGNKGQRVQIDLNNINVTKRECIDLANKYIKEAKPNGQVVIYGPSLKMQQLFSNDPKSRKLFVWAVDNLDGKGLIFNKMNYSGKP